MFGIRSHYECNKTPRLLLAAVLFSFVLCSWVNVAGYAGESTTDKVEQATIQKPAPAQPAKQSGQSAPENSKHFAGPPPNPLDDPKLQNNPRAWFDYLGYNGEFAVLAFSILLLLTAGDLAFLKKKKPALIAGLGAIPIAVFGIAVPGLFNIADEFWLHSVNDRWVLISIVQFIWGLLTIALLVLPVAIAFYNKKSNKRKWIVTGLSLGSLLLGFLWVMAMHFSFSQEKPKDKAEEPGVTEPTTS